MGRELNRLGKEKYFANKGVKRNKSKLSNLIYKVFVTQLKKDIDEERMKQLEQYKFKDLGYLSFHATTSSGSPYIGWRNVTPKELKEILGGKQYSKFCQGKREFIIQRRIDGKNI